MAKFRKKPVVIEAVQWPEAPGRGWPESWIPIPQEWRMREDERGFHLDIPTLEGVMSASEGDWIIRGVQGEFYPCKPEIFAATYEAVEE